MNSYLKLSSIPDVETHTKTDSCKNVNNNYDSHDSTTNETVATEEQHDKLNDLESIENSNILVKSHKACEDERYKKFFKMVQFGVPANAVKIKMQTEGVDASVLE